MRTFRFLVAALFILSLSAISVFAQTSTQASASTKIAVIYTDAFGDSKLGISKLVNGVDTLNKEFDQINIELKAMGTRYEKLRKEIEGLQEQVSKPGSPISTETLQVKMDEYGKLGREIQFKQEDAKAKYQSRSNIILGPIMQDIGKALQDYAKQKGYAVIFDAAKLENAGLIIGIGDEKVDVTKDFVAFYNARSAGAPTNTPK